MVNRGKTVLNDERLACDFKRTVDDMAGEWWLTAIHSGEGFSGRKGKYRDFALSCVADNRGRFWLWNRGAKKVYSDVFGSEDRALTYGSDSLLILKYSPSGIEYSLVKSIGGRAVSLYYYNLAYSLPLYIHEIDLRRDNKHALVFWWYASTCRHLGVGSKHLDPEVWEAHKKRAMRTYMMLKEFYVRGVFHGLDEEVHVHTLPGREEAVVNVFNLGDKEVSREIEFKPEEIGFPQGSP